MAQVHAITPVTKAALAAMAIRYLGPADAGYR
jgi:hypothetical protein